MRKSVFVIGGAIGGAVVISLGIAAWCVRNPPQPVLPDQADAVLVFAGDPARARTGLALVEDDGISNVLVVSHGSDPENPTANLCGQTEPFEVLCVEPDPGDTRGEAQMFAELATEQGWRAVVAVTSEVHVRRAELLLSRCWDGEVTFLGVEPTRDQGMPAVVHELGGLAQALVQRSC